MEVREYFAIARRRWLVIALTFSVVVGVASVLTFQLTPRYASSTQLFVSTPGSDTSQAYQGSLFSQERVASYADLAGNRDVASRVLEKVDTDLSAEELSDRVTATAVPETVLLEISVSDPDPERAKSLADAYAEVMVPYIASLEMRANGQDAPIKATVTERALYPTDPYFPDPTRNLGIAALLGLVVGLGLAFLREVLDTTIKSPEDVAIVSRLPVLGNIAFDSDASKRPLITEVSTHAPRAEAFRVLRTNLQFLDVDNPNKVFTISSALPAEGKTSTATNLAIALTQAGQRVLLVDADLRRPRVGGKLGLENVVGLTTVLLGKIEVQDAIQMHSRSDLAVLTSGAIPPNPAELLQSHAMAELIKNLRDEYDTVLLDAPPLLPVTDAALLAAQSDGALIVVRHAGTTKDQLSLSVQRLKAVDARPVGVVLNMVPMRRLGKSGYGYGYGYGYGPDAIGGKRRADKGRSAPPDEGTPGV